MNTIYNRVIEITDQLKCLTNVFSSLINQSKQIQLVNQTDYKKDQLYRIWVELNCGSNCGHLRVTVYWAN